MLRTQLLSTGLIVVAVIFVRFGVWRLVRKQDWASVEEGRRWLVLVRNATLVIGVFGVALVWAEELRPIGLSLVAVAVAVAISLQEPIKSVVASFVRATSGSYSIGDRIQVGDLRGYVIDHSLLQTKMLEIGPGHVRTGRTVSVPNGLFLTEPVFNETVGHDYILHSFQVPVARSEWRTARKVLQQAAEESCAPYLQPARQQMEARALRHSIGPPIVEPIVLAKPTATDVVELRVRVPVAASDVWKVEYVILQSWLDHQVDPETR